MEGVMEEEGAARPKFRPPAVLTLALLPKPPNPPAAGAGAGAAVVVAGAGAGAGASPKPPNAGAGAAVEAGGAEEEARPNERVPADVVFGAEKPPKPVAAAGAAVAVAAAGWNMIYIERSVLLQTKYDLPELQLPDHQTLRSLHLALWSWRVRWRGLHQIQIPRESP